MTEEKKRLGEVISLVPPRPIEDMLAERGYQWVHPLAERLSEMGSQEPPLALDQRMQWVFEAAARNSAKAVERFVLDHQGGFKGDDAGDRLLRRLEKEVGLGPIHPLEELERLRSRASERRSISAHEPRPRPDPPEDDAQ